MHKYGIPAAEDCVYLWGLLRVGVRGRLTISDVIDRAQL